MSRLLHRLGALAHRRPWPFIIVWLLILGSVIGLAATSNGRISSSLTIDGTPSQRVLDQLRVQLPAASGGQGTVVFTAPPGERLDEGERAAAIGAATADITALPVVIDRSAHAAENGAPATGAQPGREPGSGTSDGPGRGTSDGPGSGTSDGPSRGAGGETGQADGSPRPLVVDGHPVPGVLVSPTGDVAMLQLQFTTQVDQFPEGTTDRIIEIATRDTASTGVTALPSESLESMHPPIGGHEAIGLGVALVVLLITLGSLWAAGLPIITALSGVAIGVGGAFALSTSITLTTATPALALMIGLAVGIDYALFIVNRQRRLILIDGLTAPAATARALATAGTAVVFAGSTVIIALTGLTIIGIGFLSTMALVAAATVVFAVLIALTLLPALLGVVGERTCSSRARAAGSALAADEERHLASRWVGLLVRRPWFAIVGVVAVLGIAALPAASMSLGMPTGATDQQGSTARLSYDAISRGFGPGFNGPLVVVAQRTDDTSLDPTTINTIGTELGATADVRMATLLGTNPQRSLAVFTVIPAEGPEADSTSELVRSLRGSGTTLSSQGLTIGVTGLTAVNIDISERLGDVLPEYIAIIVGLSLLLLLVVFRSVVIPIKATLGFLLSIAATFGLTTAVFQWGWLMALAGIDTSGPLLSFLPIMVTGILYGLAMDYQVFLVSAMREAHEHGLGAREAIIHGFDHSSRVVVAAAVIMVSVFSGFIFSTDPMIKQFGFALAIGIVIDAFLVRMTLVPAVMSLLGDRAWWLPRWLDRLLPTISVEGAAAPTEPEQVSSRA